MALLRRKDNPEARMSLGDHFREFRRRAIVAVLASQLRQVARVASAGRGRSDQLAKQLLAGDIRDGDVVPVNVSADGESLVLG